MDKLTNQQALDIMHESCKQYRARILHSCTILENIMDQIISCYFIQWDDLDRRNEFISIILAAEGISWHNKSKMLNYIIGVVCPEFKKAKEPEKTLANRVGDIIAERNVIAHRIYQPRLINFPKKPPKKGQNISINLKIDKAGNAGLKTEDFILDDKIVDKKVTEIYEVGQLLRKVLDKVIRRK